MLLFIYRHFGLILSAIDYGLPRSITDIWMNFTNTGIPTPKGMVPDGERHTEGHKA